VNFFGHAAVASWRSTSPSFVLGAMLPDFAAMIRTRPPAPLEPSLARGVALHHETDYVFHDSRIFRELCHWAHADLAHRGLPRGPARAVAHIGTEILLDGALAADRVARHAYLSAIALGKTLGEADVAWHDPDSAGRFAELVGALCSRGISRSHHTPEIVALRVARALANRPRLALDAAHHEQVVDWARLAEPRVLAQSQALLAELREALAVPEARC
jgi:hypothetical protein